MSRVAITLLSIGAALVGAVHVVSDLDPVGHRLSEYATEAGGGLMTAAFVVIGLGLLALAMAFWTTQAPPLPRRIVSVAVALAGIGMIVAGVFPTEPGAATVAEIIHSRASAAASLFLIGGAAVWSFWPGTDRSAVLRTLAAVVAALGVLSVALHETEVSGLGQRLLWLALIAWLVIAAATLHSRTLLPTAG
jgi:Protein of unknown function (DUF998)